MLLLTLPTDVVVELTTVAVAFTVIVEVEEVAAGGKGVMYVVVVVIPEETVSVSVVVVVVLGLGQTGNEMSVVRESADTVRVVNWALTPPKTATSRRVLIAIAKIKILVTSIKIMILV